MKWYENMCGDSPNRLDLRSCLSSDNVLSGGHFDIRWWKEFDDKRIRFNTIPAPGRATDGQMCPNNIALSTHRHADAR